MVLPVYNVIVKISSGMVEWNEVNWNGVFYAKINSLSLVSSRIFLGCYNRVEWGSDVPRLGLKESFIDVDRGGQFWDSEVQWNKNEYDH